jgi:hypothetical protein
LKLKYSLKIFENIEIKNLIKIRPMGVVFHADGYDEANSHFPQFCELPKIQQLTRQSFRRWH